MSRLASSARDFAIACLARGDWMSAEDALSLAGEHDAASALQRHHPYRSFDFGPDIVEPRIVWRGDRRVGVRVALYLRCLRRAEALERGEEWAGFRRANGGPGGPHRLGRPIRPSRPWRPLWLDAPAFQAGVTPKDRRRATMSAPRDA